MPPKVLTEEQQQQYYSQEGPKANPLSPAAFAASLNAPVISPKDLEQPTLIQAPTRQTPTADLDLESAIQTNVINPYKQSLEQKTKGTAADTGSALKGLLDKLSTLEGKEGVTSRLYAEDVDPAKKELDEINQQILAEQVGLERKLEEIDKNPEGLFGGALEDKKEKVRRESLRKQADLSIIQMARQGRYDSAKEIADKAVSAQMERQKIQFDYASFIYNEYKDLFSTAEQREFEELRDERRRKIDEEEASKKNIYNLAVTALENGAPSSLAQNIMRAGTTEEAVGLMGVYGRKPKDSGKGTEIIESADFPSWDEYLKEAQRQARMSFGPELINQLKAQYEKDRATSTTYSTSIDFTDAELKKLEAAGLLGASRQEQLKFLYPEKEDDDISNILGALGG